MESPPRVLLLRPTDWLLLKAARLAALDDSPHAFMSRYERECRWTESQWRQLFHSANWVVAKDDSALVGLTRSVAERSSPQARYLESIWVAPTHRRKGVFRSLLTQLARVERRMGVTDFLLWVLEDNHVARRVYEAVGFEPTGGRQYLPHLGRFELELGLDIAGVTAW